MRTIRRLTFSLALRRSRPTATDGWENLHKTGSEFYNKYLQEGNSGDLAQAIVNWQGSLDLFPTEHPKRYLGLISLATALMYRYRQEGHLDDLVQVIQYSQEALDVLSSTEILERSCALNNLVNAFSQRYDREGSLEDLGNAIQSHQEALILWPTRHPNRSQCLNNLGVALTKRYDREGNLEDLSQAIQYHQEALVLRFIGHPDRPLSLDNLSFALSKRYDMEGNADDICQAIQHHQEALALRLSGHLDRSNSLNYLRLALLQRYSREGNLEDLDHAIQNYQEALVLRPTGHSGRPNCLYNLGCALSMRYDREGNLGDLIQAIQYYQEALCLWPTGHPDLHYSLDNLGVALSMRYDREGDLEHFGQAIQYYEEAFVLRPIGHPDRPNSLENLAGAFFTRYDREGNLEDLIHAIQYYQEALVLRPTVHPYRSASLNNVGLSLSTRYDQKGNLEDLIEAIQHYQEALALRPPGHPDRSNTLNDLGSTLSKRYDRDGNLEDLNQAIRYHQEALVLRPTGHPSRPDSLGHLGLTLSKRYGLEGNSEDLVQAIRHHQEALVLQPSGHPLHSTYLLLLALAFLAWHERLSATDQYPNPATSHEHECGPQRLVHAEPVNHHLENSDCPDAPATEIIALLREASFSANCPPRDCLRAALDWVTTSQKIDPTSTMEAYSSALYQLDVVLASGQSLDQRQGRLLSDSIVVKTRDLGERAATWALQRGELERAVELLERGRTLLMAQLRRYRVELSDLHQVNSELADRFADLSRRLDVSVVSNRRMEEASSPTGDSYERYRQVSTEWTKAVHEIRALPNFGTFLKPIPCDKLREAAGEGPIIIVVPNASGSDALIVLENAPIHHVQLPLATSGHLAELSDIFAYALDPANGDSNRAEGQCMATLRALRNDVVRPIGRALRDDLGIPLHSRIWWCPTSAASFLPLHAAGLYSRGQPLENLPNLYISSYTPTLQSLLRARRHVSAQATKNILVVSQPDTPGEPRLSHAMEEAGAIVDIVSPTRGVTMLSTEAGTLQAVQSQMEHHPWVHFICHGIQASDQPLESYLLLHDGRLTLRKIIEQNLPNADFAFLSACHSAAGDKILSNESLHIAGAMQFSGFRGIVGTLWTMWDDDGCPLAEAFYREMVKSWDSRKAAVALSEAIKHLRRDKVPVSHWIRFVHTGI